MKKALIIGITGQDGFYLSKYLLSKGYEVHGVIRKASSLEGVEKTKESLLEESVSKEKIPQLHFGDLSDKASLIKILQDLEPDEIYNFGAQSNVRMSFNMPEYTAEINGLGVLRVFEAIREVGLIEKTRYFQASSSEMFGQSVETPQKETTIFNPGSPYACAKVYAHYLTINYRKFYNLHASSGILFNHESPRRGEAFVSRKITRAATRIKLGLQEKLYLGNLDAKRDWGYAKDYVEAMWLILQQDQPDDYIIATGQEYSVRNFCEEAFSILDLDWRDYVEVNTGYQRSKEAMLVLGDISKAKKQLNWEPRTSFEELVRLMVESDLVEAELELEKIKN